MYSEEDIELYDEYLNFVRRKIIDEHKLQLQTDDIDFYEVEHISNGMRFVTSDEETGFHIVYDAIDFDLWLKMKNRTDRLNQLGI
jgi:hypothetical protein